MSDIFISYARANREVAQKLADDLAAQGYDVWWDTRLVGSDDYHHVLLEQLNKAKAVIVIWSEVAIKSRFVIDEANRALNQDKLISTCLPDFNLTSLPLGFGGRHTDCVEERSKIIEGLDGFALQPQLAQRSDEESLIIAENYINIASNYYFGEAIERNFSKAMQWYKKAADLGDSKATFYIGVMHKNGQGTEQDFREAMHWYKKSAELRNADAMKTIALFYFKGLGIEQDFKKAMRWYKKAADLGDTGAMSDIGLLYCNGKATKQDFKKAKYWFEAAAKQGDAHAMYALGTLYQNGQGVERDAEQAADWIFKAIEGGNDFSIQEMCAISDKGGKDFREALQHRLKSAEFYNGSIDAIFGPESIAAIKALAGNK